MGRFFGAIKRAASDFIEDDCMSSGAAIAYYTIFSLPPLLVIVFFAARSLGVDEDTIREVVTQQMGVPTDAVEAQGSSGFGEFGILSRVIGIALLVFSATGVFGQLQYSLNRAWEVAADPKGSGIWTFVFKRLLSLGMIVVLGFLLLVSLVLTTAVEQVLEYFQGGAAEGAMLAFGIILNHVATLLVATVLFAAMFKMLPDVKMAWRDIWVGGAFTALLFVIGKALLSWYIHRPDVASGWSSAAGSMVAVLVWVYYSSLIVLFGAEVTQVWANRYGRGIEPAKGAVRMVEERHAVPAK